MLIHAQISKDTLNNDFILEQIFFICKIDRPYSFNMKCLSVVLAGLMAMASAVQANPIARDELMRVCQVYFS